MTEINLLTTRLERIRSPLGPKLEEREGIQWYYGLASNQALSMTTVTETVHVIFAMSLIVINGPRLQNQMIRIVAQRVMAQV